MRRQNPWCLVSAAEYEAYMGDAGAGLLAPLSTIFARIYAARRPRRLALLGVATGNGLEHVDAARSGRTVGVDVNLSYLAVARQRFLRLGPRLELLCADAERVDLGAGALDLVHAGLVLEWLDPRAAVARAAEWLAPGGAFSAVLRVPRGAPMPPAPGALASVAAAERLVPPSEVRDLAARHGLEERRAFEVVLPSGRRLFAALWEKRRAWPK